MVLGPTYSGHYRQVVLGPAYSALYRQVVLGPAYSGLYRQVVLGPAYSGLYTQVVLGAAYSGLYRQVVLLYRWSLRQVSLYFKTNSTCRTVQELHRLLAHTCPILLIHVCSMCGCAQCMTTTNRTAGQG